MPGDALSQRSAHDRLHAVDPAALARMDMPALDELFAQLEPARLEQLQGHKRGRLLAVKGIDWLPGIARATLMAVINRLPIWSGESFDGEFGANAWVLPGARLEFARCLVREREGFDGEGEVLQLDYDVAANPKFLRDVVGELRQLRPGLFLVRTRYRLRGQAFKVSYFTLEG